MYINNSNINIKLARNYGGSKRWLKTTKAQNYDGSNRWLKLRWLKTTAAQNYGDSNMLVSTLQAHSALHPKSKFPAVPKRPISTAGAASDVRLPRQGLIVLQRNANCCVCFHCATAHSCAIALCFHCATAHSCYVPVAIACDSCAIAHRSPNNSETQSRYSVITNQTH